MRVEEEQSGGNQRDRRGAARFDLALGVNFLLSNRVEGSGQLLNISESGLALFTDVAASEGEEAILYPEGMGRVRGKVARTFKGGFAVAFLLTAKQKETMKQRISAVVEGLPYLRLAENRSSIRLHYNIETQARIAGSQDRFDCLLVDMSRGGCRVQCEDKPPVGHLIYIGALMGVVLRHEEDGFAVEFLGPSSKHSSSATSKSLNEKGAA